MMYEYCNDCAIYDEEEIVNIAWEEVDEFDCIEVLKNEISWSEIWKCLDDDMKMRINEIAVERFIENNFIEVGSEDEDDDYQH